MKLMIASDIHGSAYWCEKLVGRYQAERPDKLMLLGDILYHGPRNDFPQDYCPQKVMSLLSPLKKEILCVRGNCDSEVDQMVLPFPILADYAIVYSEGAMIFATHGHIYNLMNLPPIHEGDVLLHGHTHVPACAAEKGVLYLNPGSVALPKEDSRHSYMTLEDGLFTWKDLEGGSWQSHRLQVLSK